MAVNRTETLDEYARRLEGDADGSGSALPGLPDLRDLLLPRPGRLPGPGREPPAGPARGPAVRQLPCACGCPAAPPAKRRTRSPSACWSERGNCRGNPSFQIFATDLSESALKKARAGIYPREHRGERLPGAPAAVLRQGGRPLPDQQGHPRDVRVRPPRPDPGPALLQDGPHQLPQPAHLPGAAPPGARVRILPLRAQPRGVPPAGAGGRRGDGLRPVLSDSTRDTRCSRGKPPPLPRTSTLRREPPRRAHAAAPVVLTPKAALRSEVPREADRMLLARYGPPGVVVDEALNIVEFRGDTDPFLEHAHGQASLNLIQMARRGLLVELRQAIEEAREKGVPSRKEGLRIRYRGRLHKVSVEVIPIKGRAEAEHCLLVLFEADRRVHARGTPRRRRCRAPAAEPGTRGSRSSKRSWRRPRNTSTPSSASTTRRWKSCSPPTRRRSPATKSCRASTRSSRPPSRRSSRRTKSWPRSTRSCRTGTPSSACSTTTFSTSSAASTSPSSWSGKDLHLRRFTPAAENLFSLMPSDVGRPLGDLRTYLEAPDLEARGPRGDREREGQRARGPGPRRPLLRDADLALHDPGEQDRRRGRWW